jgi:hypothetical protein
MNYKNTILVGLLLTCVATQAKTPTKLDTAKKYGLATLYAGGTALTGLAAIGSVLLAKNYVNQDPHEIRWNAQNMYNFETNLRFAGALARGASALSAYAFFAYLNARLAIYCTQKAKATLRPQEKKKTTVLNKEQL